MTWALGDRLKLTATGAEVDFLWYTDDGQAHVVDTDGSEHDIPVDDLQPV